ncbi:ParE family toxin-like protein [Synechocystis salina]
MWRDNPFYPSLHFKCINREENVWFVRISLNYRALGLLKKDTVNLFWIGSHKNYEQFYS